MGNISALRTAYAKAIKRYNNNNNNNNNNNSNNNNKIKMKLKKPPKIIYRSKIKKFLIFSQKSAFLLFQETEFFDVSGNGNPKQISDIFSKEIFTYISKKETPKRIPYISGNETFL